MKKLLSFFTLIVLFNIHASAQMNEFVQDGEFGILGGLSHYFGDLDNRDKLNHPKIALGAYVNKQFGDYVSVRLSGHYALLGYSDIYSSNLYDRSRNLSFNTNIFELAVQGQFNFFKFIPTDRNHAFTPYATLGIGAFTYNPYAYYDGKKYYLRPLHTEGETFYEGRKEYGTVAMCFPVGFGFKYAVTSKVNVSFELCHRFTTTDYIDDVSKTYVGIDKFPSTGGVPSIAAILQDRSFQVGAPIGIEGRQRGFSKQNDQYLIAEFGLSFNIISYHCPTVPK